MARRRLVVEADGGSRGNPGPAAYGAVVKDAETGAVLERRAEHLGTATNNVAEYQGLVAGLRAAAEIDAEATVEARLDSKLVVEQMSGRWKIKHASMKPLALEARDAFPPERVTYTWVPREQNALADSLLNEVLDGGAGSNPGSNPSPASSSRTTAATQPAQGWSGHSGAATSFVLLRHGDTELTAEKRFSGVRSDLPLTARGREQAAAAADLLARRGQVDAVVASPLLRAKQTADTVANRLGLTVQVDQDWRETDFGEWERCTFAEVAERWPDELSAWMESTSVLPPGGESFEAVGRRVRAARDRIISGYPESTVVVVTHVTPVKLLVRMALGAPARSLYRMELSSAALTSVDWYPDGNASLLSFNDTAHLRG